MNTAKIPVSSCNKLETHAFLSGSTSLGVRSLNLQWLWIPQRQSVRTSNTDCGPATGNMERLKQLGIAQVRPRISVR